MYRRELLKAAGLSVVYPWSIIKNNNKTKCLEYKTLKNQLSPYLKQMEREIREEIYSGNLENYSYQPIDCEKNKNKEGFHACHTTYKDGKFENLLLYLYKQENQNLGIPIYTIGFAGDIKIETFLNNKYALKKCLQTSKDYVLNKVIQDIRMVCNAGPYNTCIMPITRIEVFDDQSIFKQGRLGWYGRIDLGIGTTNKLSIILGLACMHNMKII